MLIALVFAAHVALLFAFGARKQIVPRPVTNVPMLKLAAEASELLALNDPTLFALPHQRDFASAVRVQTSVLKQPSFRWTEPPRWLPLSVEALGTVFDEFMQTNRFAGFELQLKPPLKLSALGLPIEPVLAQTSTLQIEDRLAQRRLLDPLNLPSWPYADVLAPSVVQTVVDAAGNVVSVVLLPPGSGWDDADRRALELARAARFAPAPRLTIGRLIFNWHTVPMTNTNEPSR
jgi:TonB family protein